MGKSKHFRLEEVLPNIFEISHFGVQMHLLVGTEKALLVDTGYGVGDLLEVIREITPLPLIVTNSHGHIDHSAGNAQFNQPVYIPRLDRELAIEHNSRQFRELGLKMMKSIQRIFFWKRWFPTSFNQEEYLNYQFENYIDLNEGDIFNLGSLTVEVVAIPGHTQGSVGFLCRERDVFIASDGINGAIWLFLNESTNLSSYIKTLKKVQQLDFKYLLTGHSGKLIPKEKIDLYLDVAENPDIENAKLLKENDFARGVHPMRVVAKNTRAKHFWDKDFASISISKDKI